MTRRRKPLTFVGYAVRLYDDLHVYAKRKDAMHISRVYRTALVVKVRLTEIRATKKKKAKR